MRLFYVPRNVSSLVWFRWVLFCDGSWWYFAFIGYFLPIRMRFRFLVQLLSSERVIQLLERFRHFPHKSFRMIQLVHWLIKSAIFRFHGRYFLFFFFLIFLSYRCLIHSMYHTFSFPCHLYSFFGFLFDKLSRNSVLWLQIVRCNRCLVFHSSIVWCISRSFRLSSDWFSSCIRIFEISHVNFWGWRCSLFD